VVGAFGTALSNGIGFTSSTGAAPAAASANNLDLRSSAGAGIAVPTTKESGKGQGGQPRSSASTVPAAAGRTPGASAAHSATPAERTGNYVQGDQTSAESGGVRGTATTSPPFGLMLGSGVVLLAVAFV